MFYVGLDVHAKFVAVCVLDDQGKKQREVKLGPVTELLHFLKSLDQPFHVAYEASCGYGEYFNLLSPLAESVTVAHPAQLHAIFKSSRKNDRNDAHMLARLLLVEMLPRVHVPSNEVRAWREMIVFRTRTVEKRTRAKNGLRALLRTLLIQAPKSLWTRKGVAWLKALEFASPMHAIKRDLLLQEIDDLNRSIRRIEKELEAFASGSPAVALLRTIPGVGIRTAEAVAAFIDDPQRFGNAKQIGAYFGLVPRQDQSGSTNRLGHITREGPSVVRKMLVEAVWQAVRRSPTVAAYRQRIRRDDAARGKIATVATAHYLCRVMWAMLKNQTVWQESGLAA